MKRFLCMAIVMISLGLQAQTQENRSIEYYFWLTDIHDTSVEGVLKITNTGSQSWSLTFPNTDFAEIWVDGTPAAVMHVPMSNTLTVPAYHSVSLNISHNRESSPYSTGIHTAQAYFLTEDPYPVGQVRSFLGGDFSSDISYPTYTLQLTEIDSCRVHGQLLIQNSGTTNWQIGYNHAPVYYISVDGYQQTSFMYWDYYTWQMLAPGEEMSVEIGYTHRVEGEITNFSPGVHTAQAGAIWLENPLLGNVIEFVVQPSGIEDPLLPPAAICLYPNPLRANDELHLRAEGDTCTDISLYNLRGQLIYQNPGLRLSAGQEVVINLASALPEKVPSPGVYLARIKSPGSVQWEKVLILSGK